MMNKYPLISIIVPVYNAEKYLNRCIDSILKQNYKNIELILVDDCSVDESAKICDYYLKKDSRIKYFKQDKNSGQASTRNLGIKYATGDFITFVDNDDTVDEQIYVNLITNAKKYNLDIVGCGTMMVYEDKKVNKFEGKKSGIIDSKEIIDNILFQTKYEWGTVWNKLFSKNIKKDLKFIENKEYEDYYLMIKLCLNNEKIYFDSRPLYNWYQRKNSQSKRGYHKGLKTFDDILEEIRNLFKNREDEDLFLEKLAYFEFVIRSKNIFSMWKSKNVSKKEMMKEFEKVKILKHKVFTMKNIYKSKKIYLYYYVDLFLLNILSFQKNN